MLDKLDQPLHYTLVNFNNWYENTFEVAKQLHINTDKNDYPYNMIWLINSTELALVADVAQTRPKGRRFWD